jgi:hypothetical protein
MTRAARASGSIVAAGIVAILVGTLSAFSTLSTLLLFATSQIPQDASVPETIRPFIYFGLIFFLLCALFVFVVAIQVIRLRNWARISLLVIAGCLLFFGFVGIIVIFFTLYVIPLPDPQISRALLAVVLGAIYGTPIAIAVWWLILLTRPSVVAQFHLAAQSRIALQPPEPLAAPPRPSSIARSFSRFNNPNCPLGVRIVGWYLASFLLVIPFLPFFPNRIPAYYFGRLFQGPAATFVYVLNFALLCIPGVGLLLLKRWSFPLTVIGQFLVCVNAVVSLFGNSYETIMRKMMQDFHLLQPPPVFEQMLDFSKYIGLFGLVVPVAILVTLFISRRKFYEAANRPGSL